MLKPKENVHSMQKKKTIIFKFKFNIIPLALSAYLRFNNVWRVNSADCMIQGWQRGGHAKLQMNEQPSLLV